MGFGVDYNEASEGKGLLPEGDYEVIIKYACEDVTKSGTVHIALTLVIRNDVEQKYQNKNLWHNIWKRKTPSEADIKCSGYGARDIQTLSKAAGLENGKKYDSFEDWYNDLRDKVILITTKNDEEWGVKVKYINASKFPECKHVFKSNNPASPDRLKIDDTAEGFVEIQGDDDLPF